jgi:hypothetical protein
MKFKGAKPKLWNLCKQKNCVFLFPSLLKKKNYIGTHFALPLGAMTWTRTMLASSHVSR